jgi:hypothetical protein
MNCLAGFFVCVIMTLLCKETFAVAVAGRIKCSKK